jgi:hypothetical protein
MCGVGRGGGSFSANGGDADDDSEVSVEKHDEAYCVLHAVVYCGVDWDAQVVMYSA